jgi:hypothetical protein
MNEIRTTRQAPAGAPTRRRLPWAALLMGSLGLLTALSAGAACKHPAPAALAFDKGSVRDSCPSGYSTSGRLCSPSGSSAGFVLIKPPSTGSCPSGYSSSGAFCIGHTGTCHAFAGHGSCPSGYSSSGPWCVSS